MVPKIMHDVKRNSKEFQEDRCSTRRVTAAGPRQVKRTTSTLYKIGAPGVTRTPGTQFRKLLLYPPELRGHADLRGTLDGFYCFVLILY